MSRNWITTYKDNTLSRFRSFKRNKQGKRLPEELVDIIEN